MDAMPRTSRTSPDARLLQARRLLDQRDLGLDALAREVGFSPAHLQRRFSQAFGLSPAEYRRQRRLGEFKRGLRAHDDVTAALYDAGYGSPSRVYEPSATSLGMTPRSYQRGGAGMAIRWTVVRTALGLALVAATERGLCQVALGEDETALEAELRDEFPNARLERVDDGRDDFLAPRVAAVADWLAGKPAAHLDVELIGTAFQRRVWQALMTIPAGQTRSYGELAVQIGQPRAVRAVASACAGNRLAVVVPCHRVIRGDGSPGGYRWGLPRKRALLAAEASGTAA
jgi:AraC family transcriptional regulator of adaptative response/methylated-DNA-[protein]-cysteine methyltransferase